MQKDYQISVLNAKTITKNIVKTGNDFEFRCDISKPHIKETLIIKTIKRNQNPFFSFLEKIYFEKLIEMGLYYSDAQKKELTANGIDPAEALSRIVVKNHKQEKVFCNLPVNPFAVIVTFEELLSQKDSTNVDLTFESYTINNSELCYKLLIENGFYLENTTQHVLFDTSKSPLHQESIHYIPYITSASMAKNKYLIFVREDFISLFDKYLMLDMDITNVEENASKFNAYKGLYLSDGYDELDDLGVYNLETYQYENIQIKLNETNVIVIDDKYYSQVANYITAECIDSKKQLWDVVEKNEELTTNLFDGEGLISFEYAHQISKNKKPSSYQIRMPFCKGVLHAVDFHRFAKKIFGTNDIEITDFWGIKRNLKEAHVIITKSMLKCAKWLKEAYHIENINENDPMACYFKKYNDYGHVLRINKDGLSLSNATGTVSFNYQFASTLDINNAEFLQFILSRVPNFEKIEISSKNINEFPELKKLMIDETTLYDVLSLNDNFAKDTHIKGIYKKFKQTELKRLGRGNFEVTGENRFLSRDLLAFLIHLFEYSSVAEFPQLERLKEELIDQNSFYAPKMILESKQRCAILRNPHLSRNEQCCLEAFVPDSKSIYKEFFGHLKSVVFIAEKSLAANAIGGADFDGDIIKILTDAEIVNAIVKGCYTDGEKLRRTLPIIEIPSTANSNKQFISNKIDAVTILNTFGNKIGQISNYALSISQMEYFGDNKDGLKNMTALCGILVGLEIDATKSGVHPNLAPIEALLKDKPQPLFLSSKYYISNFDFYRNYVASESDSKYLIESSKTDDVFLSLEKKKIQYNIDQFPVLFFKNCEKIKSCDIVKNNDTHNEKFVFENAPNSIQLDEKFETVLKDLIIGFYDHQDYVKNTKIVDSNNASAIASLLCKKGNGNYEEKTIEVDRIISTLMYTLETTEDAEIAWNSLLENNWAFASKENRIGLIEEAGLTEAFNQLSESDQVDLIDFKKNGYLTLLLALKYCYASYESRTIIDSVGQKLDELKSLLPHEKTNEMTDFEYVNYSKYRLMKLFFNQLHYGKKSYTEFDDEAKALFKGLILTYFDGWNPSNEYIAYHIHHLLHSSRFKKEFKDKKINASQVFWDLFKFSDMEIFVTNQNEEVVENAQ